MTRAAPHVSPGSGRYLEAIWYLRQEGERVRAGRLAEWLGVSAPSVSEALRRLERDRLVRLAGREIELTTAGATAAAAVVRRHRVLESWLTTDLGLDWVAADEEAHVLAAAMSDTVLERLYERLGRPATCPHGNTIPGSHASAPAQQNLTATAAGAQVEVVRVSELAEHEAPDVLHALQAGGLLPGARLTVCRPMPGGAVEVDAPAGRLALPEEVARAVWVRTPAAGRLPEPRARTVSPSAPRSR